MTTRNRLAKSEATQPRRTQQEICDDSNAKLAADPEGRRDIEWKVINDRAMLVWKKTSLAMLQDTQAARIDPMDRRGQRMSESDTYKLNRKLEELGSPYRYRWDGSRHHVSGQSA